MQNKRLVMWSTPHPSDEENFDYELTEFGVLLRTLPDQDLFDIREENWYGPRTYTTRNAE